MPLRSDEDSEAEDFMTIRSKRTTLLAAAMILAVALGVWFTASGKSLLAAFLDGSNWSVSKDGAWQVNRMMLLSARAHFYDSAEVASLDTTVATTNASTVRHLPTPVIVLVEGEYWNHQEFLRIEGFCDPPVEHREVYNRRLYKEVVDERACAFSGDLDPKTNRFTRFQFKGASSRGDTGDPRWHEVRGGAWKVNRALVAIIKNRVQEAAASPASGRGMEPNLPEVSDYFVQVQGQVENGKQVVELFGACRMGTEDSRYLDWKMIVIFDGGPCLFSGKFDVESQRLLWFYFNGSA